MSILYSATCDSYMFNSDAMLCMEGGKPQYHSATQTPHRNLGVKITPPFPSPPYLHLFGLLLEGLLVDLQLLSNLWPWLPLQHLFHLHVQLLLLLNQ